MNPVTIAEFQGVIESTVTDLLRGGTGAMIEAGELRSALESLALSVGIQTQQKARNQLLLELMTVDQVAERLGMPVEEVLQRIEMAHLVRGIGRQVESGGWLLLEEELDLL